MLERRACHIDDKSRVSVPAEFRETVFLQNSMYVQILNQATRSAGLVAIAMGEDRYEELCPEPKVQSIDELAQYAQRINNYGEFVKINVSGNGRIVLPRGFRELFEQEVRYQMLPRIKAVGIWTDKFVGNLNMAAE